MTNLEKLAELKDRVREGPYPFTTEGARQSRIKASLLTDIAQDILEGNTEGKDTVQYILHCAEVKLREIGR